MIQLHRTLQWKRRHCHSRCPTESACLSSNTYRTTATGGLGFDNYRTGVRQRRVFDIHNEFREGIGTDFEHRHSVPYSTSETSINLLPPLDRTTIPSLIANRTVKTLLEMANRI
ncbi:hypothetical protein ACOME3_008127 [Neoechinorhynchus agilis]